MLVPHLAANKGIYTPLIPPGGPTPGTRNPASPTAKVKGQTSRSALLFFAPQALSPGRPFLLGSELFLLAFHAHRLELALFGFVRLLHLGLDACCRLFQLR